MSKLSDPEAHGHYFCDNEACDLHVTHVDGCNWAELADGRWYGRARAGNYVYCDACLKDPLKPVRIENDAGG